MKRFLGEERVMDHDIWMASEDFAYDTRQVDSLIYLLGVSAEGRDATPLHTQSSISTRKPIETGIGCHGLHYIEYLL